MKRLKADLHTHTKEDPIDKVKYSAKELIDLAAKGGFEVLAITNHGRVTYNMYLRDYAKDRGILLIPGVEAYIRKKHVLLLNMDYSPHKIKTIQDIKRVKNSSSLVIAPHPFYPSITSLHSTLVEHPDIFDAIEYSHFYLERINFNRKAEEFARNHGLPVIGTSDAHFLWQLNTTYSLIEAEKDVESIIAAIKERKVEIVTKPLPFFKAGIIGVRLLFHSMLDFFDHVP